MRGGAAGSTVEPAPEPGLRARLIELEAAVARVEALLLAALVAAMTCVTFAQVLSRYVLNSPLIWSEELARYLFVWVVLLGGALGVRGGEHFGLDLLKHAMSPAVRSVVGTVASVIVAAFLVVLLITGLREAHQAAGQTSPVLEVGLHWAYLAIPVGAAFGLLHMAGRWLRLGPAVRPLDPLHDAGMPSEQAPGAAVEAPPGENG